MSKTTAPLLSFSASGQLGETIVFSRWKGRPYARRYVIPANPRSAAQTLTRNTFAALNSIWSYMPAAAKAAWKLYAENSRITDRNGWIKQNLSALRPETDLTEILLSPAAGGGLVASAIDVTAGTGQLTVGVTPPTLPTGWTVVQANAVALADENPQAMETPAIVAGDDDTDPYSIVLSGLEAGVLHVVGAWFEYAKPNGESAYGASLQTTATPA